jgi:hypothetical protein
MLIEKGPSHHFSIYTSRILLHSTGRVNEKSCKFFFSPDGGKLIESSCKAELGLLAVIKNCLQRIYSNYEDNMLFLLNRHKVSLEGLARMSHRE